MPLRALASDRMYMGAAEDEGRNGDPTVATDKMELAKAAGFGEIRPLAAGNKIVLYAGQRNWIGKSGMGRPLLVNGKR